MEDFVKVSLSDTSRLQRVFKCWMFLAVRFFLREGAFSPDLCAAEVAPRTDRLALAESWLLRHAPRHHCLEARIKQKMKCVMQVVRHLTCENMDVPENGAQRGVKTRVTTGTEDVHVRGQVIANF